MCNMYAMNLYGVYICVYMCVHIYIYIYIYMYNDPVFKMWIYLAHGYDKNIYKVIYLYHYVVIKISKYRF